MFFSLRKRTVYSCKSYFSIFEVYFNEATFFIAKEGMESFSMSGCHKTLLQCALSAGRCVLVDWGRSLARVAFGACGGSAVVAWLSLFCRKGVFP